MRCPKCVNEGKKSRVFDVPITCVTMEMKYDYNFYDDEGKYHNHNHSKFNYRCSNEHTFTETIHCAFGDCCDKNES